ncbi:MULTISPECIES: histidine kinase dimerization/phosphoacceptor domain -containing protein [unclassified Mesorhizobium]|uniref:sensor histidine kinase n=2 Tax=Mesorhizobium TaxID=68287 RepID=UPI000FD92845|nr:MULTISPECIES: histidine kinase dimerization/phosphoacceptor domain -containing protein [unclassified Mesorhizobium]TGR41220.1 PAS domain-containing protein [bacterium M00.F.Ca.ET.199.01.1.1]TGU32044.1 PAS domain-containing protein [bacterium M00.F.Ca.ET.156.01.1.1]TGV86157.1 PAS domain-containing protein [Mesorhizobium sp. M00.F.Ca.ET.149.01.1.1]TGR25946.1 PAS domain-containing protein [Mesorhizobium sp. M8A.F.Ca.ET.197.01.1.1]TGR26396.1 PAS domain-containing protein [Mesorhizobium sp. M8A.
MDWKRTREPADAWHMTDDLHVEQGKGDPFAAAIRATRMSMIITDPRRHDNPIVFANDAFLRLTGYERHEVIGKNCRFLQGPKSDKAAIAEIRAAIENETDLSVDILNYRKDGSSFWNALYISPVSNDKGELQFFFASQLDVSDRKRSEHRITADKDRFEKAVRERTAELEAALEAQTTLLHEVDHRVKNNLQMISSLILMQSRAASDENLKRSLGTMLERIEALSTVHRRLYQSKDVSKFDVSDFARDLVSELLTASGRSEINPKLDLESIIIPAEKATPVALMVNELLTNALKHAFKEGPDGTRSGSIGIKMSQPDGHLNIEVSDDGVGMADANGDASFGMRLIKSLARQLRADIEWRDAGPGTRVVISMPNGPQHKGNLS